MESNKEETEKVLIDNEAHLCELHYQIGKTSLDFVQRRYESLISSASHIMSCISILSIALVTLLPVLLDCLDESFLALMQIFYLIVFLLLAVSLFLSLFSRFRFGYKILDSPSFLASYIKENKSEFDTVGEYGEFYCNCLNDSYTSIQKMSDLISALIRASTIILMVAIVLIVVFGFTLFCASVCF